MILTRLSKASLEIRLPFGTSTMNRNFPNVCGTRTWISFDTIPSKEIALVRENKERKTRSTLSSNLFQEYAAPSRPVIAVSSILLDFIIYSGAEVVQGGLFFMRQLFYS